MAPGVRAAAAVCLCGIGGTGDWGGPALTGEIQSGGGPGRPSRPRDRFDFVASAGPRTWLLPSGLGHCAGALSELDRLLSALADLCLHCMGLRWLACQSATVTFDFWYAYRLFPEPSCQRRHAVSVDMLTCLGPLETGLSSPPDLAHSRPREG